MTLSRTSCFLSDLNFFKVNLPDLRNLFDLPLKSDSGTSLNLIDLTPPDLSIPPLTSRIFMEVDR